ncbi:MAG: C39 family peptidase, partial [Bacteroidota bacterium]|nr:C39 family peptidase [Bacteroidota bacterium]
MNIQKWLNLLLFSVFLSFSVQAQYLTDLGNNNYSLGLPSDQFKDVYANQRKSNWCWAACVQMVMNYQGIKIEQEEIVMKTFGSLVDQPAYVPDMIKAITGWAPSVDGHKNFIFCDNLNSLSFKELYESLNRGKPFIVGLRNLS